MEMYETPQPVEKYLNVPLKCSCGRVHYAPIKAVEIGKGALGSLVKYVRDFDFHRPYILCDEVTYRIAGRRCQEMLTQAGIAAELRILRHLGFDEATLGEILIYKPEDCDLMIGCGTGSITDILRYASFKLKLPCFSVATGAPMDGFSASVGIMNVNGLKATMPAHSTEVIIGDTDILAGAPYRMTVAGFADLIGKLNALNDWRLAVLIDGCHYCGNIDRLVSAYVNNILSEAGEIRQRNPAALGDVFNALLLTGASISLYGSSRPISGAEHHMSHYWEVLGDQRGKPYAMHGEQVAVGTVLALMVTEELRKTPVDFAAAREQARVYDPERWRAEVERAYGTAAGAVLELEERTGKNRIEGRLRRIDTMETRWGEIMRLLEGAYPAEKLRELLRFVDCPCDPKDIGITAPVLKDTFLYCKETRAVYTAYQMAWDLGLMDAISDRIIEKLRSAGRLDG